MYVLLLCMYCYYVCIIIISLDIVAFKSLMESNIKSFLDVLLPHKVTEITLDDDYGSQSYVRKIEEIRSSLKDDRVYKFVKSIKSLKVDELPMEDSIEWKGVSNAVEVYKLPSSRCGRLCSVQNRKKNRLSFPNFL